MTYFYFFVPLVAFVFGRVAIRIVRRFAAAIGFIDKPDSRRKLQESPIALGGGLAVWMASWLGWGAGMVGGSPATAGLAEGIPFYCGLAIASFSMLVVGLVDDRIGLRGSHKLVGQLASAAFLVASGFRVDALGGFGWSMELGVLSVPFTIFWVILIVNAFNLIDGMDGFCGGVGFVAAIALALLSFWFDRPTDALAGLAIAGALAAFLGDNLPPARIYLGDAGSMSLGTLIAALSIRACSHHEGGTVSLPALLALLALPLLDVITALGRRWLTGHSLFTPDRGHIHHRLRSRLGNTLAATAVAVGLATIGACGATVAMTSGLGDLAAGFALLASVSVLVGTDTFGGSELRLLLFRIRPTVTNFLTSRSSNRVAIRHECHLLGSRDWSGVWDALVCDAEAAGLHRVELMIDLPAAGETFHALWSIRVDPQGRPDWSIAHQIQVGGSNAGVLRVAGIASASRARYLEKIEELLGNLEFGLERELGQSPDGRLAKPIFPAVIHDQAAQSILGPSLA